MHTFHVPMAPLTAFLLFMIVSTSVISPVRASSNTTCCEMTTEGLTQSDKLSAQKNSEPTANFAASSNQTKLCNETKTEQFCNCVSKVCLEPGEYEMVDGIAHVSVYKTSYSSSSYNISEGGCLLICWPTNGDPRSGKNESVDEEDLNLRIQAYMTFTGLCISILCLAMHLIAFAMISELRNTPGYCMACFCASLLAGDVSFLSAFDEHVMDSSDACLAAAASAHFFLLSSFLWMNVIAYDIFKSLLNATGKLRVASESVQFRRLCIYCSYSWGVALVFAVVAVVSDKVESFPEEYKPLFGKQDCWFNKPKSLLVFFAGPVFAVICTNVVFFGRSAYILVASGINSDNSQHGTLSRNLVMYVRLAVIMGLTWVVGLLAVFIKEPFLGYIYVLLNSFQGLFVFLGFTCTTKVKKELWRRFGSMKRKRSMQTSWHT